MVHAFAVVTIDEAAGPTPLLWHGFTRDWNIPRESAQRNFAALAQRVHADFRLRAACDDSFASSGRLGPSPSAPGASLSQQEKDAKPSQLFSVPEGVLRLSVSPSALPPPPGPASVVRVVWRFIPQFAAVASMVLQDGESLGMAAHVLAVICRVMCEQTSSGGSSSAMSSSTRASGKTPQAVRKELFETRPDEAVILLEHFLPSGQLVILSSSYSKHLRKEAEALMSSKS